MYNSYCIVDSIWRYETRLAIIAGNSVSAVMSVYIFYKKALNVQKKHEKREGWIIIMSLTT